MARLIIVEGMDNTGKTTLIQRITREVERGFSTSIVSLGPNVEPKLQYEWLGMILDHVGNSIFPYIVCDRFLPICDTIYGNILRGGSIWNLNDSILDYINSVYDVRIIYCRPPMKKIVGFEDGREQMSGVEAYAEVLTLAYDESMKNLSRRDFKIYHYDYTKEGHTNLSGVKSFIEKTF